MANSATMSAAAGASPAAANAVKDDPATEGKVIVGKSGKTNRVAGQMAADIGKSLGGSIGRAIVRGTLGGILRR